MAAVSKNGDTLVLLKFDPRNNHAIAEIAKEFIEFELGKIYRITIDEHHGDVATTHHE